MPIIYRHRINRSDLYQTPSTFTVQWLLMFEIFFRAIPRSINQAVSRRHLTAKARVHLRAGASEICGEQSGSGTSSSPNTSIFSCQFHSANTQSKFMCQPFRNYKTDGDAWSVSRMKSCYGNLEAPNCTEFWLIFGGVWERFSEIKLPRK